MAITGTESVLSQASSIAFGSELIGILFYSQLRVLSTPKFIEVFQSGVEFYLSGNWGSARKKLEEADDLMKDSDVGGDGPSRTLLNYMRARDWICPPDWRGYRPLTSK